jgi:hypothetical protein
MIGHRAHRGDTEDREKKEGFVFIVKKLDADDTDERGSKKRIIVDGRPMALMG